MLQIASLQIGEKNLALNLFKLGCSKMLHYFG